MEEKTKMDRITESMAEHICDELCHYPKDNMTQEELDAICAGCKMGKFVCGLLNIYNKVNERNVPKKPILKNSKSVVFEDYADGHGEVKVNMHESFHCPNCDWFVGEYFKPRFHAQQKKQFCDSCGLSIDWSDWTYEKEKAKREQAGGNNGARRI